MISPEQSAKEPKWWYDDRYAIYDLNVNSAVVHPQHDEVLRPAKAGPTATYTAQGYAYAGGGRRINRVEVSLDKGKCKFVVISYLVQNTDIDTAWRLANVEYPEDKYREYESDLFGGKVDMFWRETCFCWCFWNLEIPISDLTESDAILVRAMDEALSIQPRDMYWSVLGMMNNPWFRVAVINDGDTIRFEHPTQPALMPGGWMERVKKAGGDLTNGHWGEVMSNEEVEANNGRAIEEINMKKEGLDRKVDLAEFKAHISPGEPWFVVNGEVYDGTKFLEGHPGGAQSIVSAAGMDVSEEFLAIRKFQILCLDGANTNNIIDSETAKAMMPDYHIGTLDKTSLKVLHDEAQNQSSSGTPDEKYLQPKVWKKAELCAKRSISWDTRVFTFKLDYDLQFLGLPTGQHLMVKLKDSTTSESIIRAYTPISETNQQGTLDLLIKVYTSTPAEKGGKMTMALDKLAIGDNVEIKGPIGKLTYLGHGKVLLNDKQRDVKSFRMICGGSGITPIYQVLRAVVKNAQDPTHCVVLDGNRMEEDILCREELDSYAALNDERCTIVHTLTKPSSDWKGLKGRIGEELLKQYAPPSADGDSMALICGPEGMEKATKAGLLKMGWDENDLVFF